MSDILRWLNAVFWHWQSWVGGSGFGGAVVVLVNLYERLTDHSMNKRIYVTIFIVCFLIGASFLAWRDQYHATLAASSAANAAQQKFKELTQPNFELSWAAATIGEGDFEQGNQKVFLASTYIQIAILNHGAPSVIKDWKGLVRLTDGKELEGKLVLPSPNVTMNQWVGKSRLPLSPALIPVWSNTPIPTGGRGVGSVLYWFPAGTKAKVEGPGGALIFKLWDIEGKESKVEIPWQKGATTNEFGPAVPALPGMTGN